MENKKDNNVVWVGCFAFILIVIIAISIIVSVSKGLFYFFISGGWKWLLVVGGTIIFALLVAHANGE